MTESPTSGPGPTGESGRVRFRRLFKNTGIYAAGEAGLQLMSALLTPILTLFLLPEDFGVWSLAMMLYTGFMHLCNPALHGAVTRFFFDHEHDELEKRRFQGTILSFLFVWSFGMCVLATLAGPAVFDSLFDDLPFWPYGMFIVVMALLGVLGVVPKAVWVAAEKSKAFVGVNLLGTSVNLAGQLGLVSLTSLGVLGLFWGRTASLIVLAVPFLIVSIRDIGFAWHWPDLRSALRFSLPLVPHLLAHWVLGMSDRFIIEDHYAEVSDATASAEFGSAGTSIGLQAVGIYSAAYVFMDAVNMVAASMNRAWVPQFTRAHGRPEERQFVARSITLMVLAIGAMSTGMIVLAPTLVRGVFDSQYTAAAEIAPILALAGLFQGLYYVYVAVLFYHKSNRLIPVITVTSGAVNIGLNLWWLPIFGLAGAAWATFVGYLVLLVGVRAGARRLPSPSFETARLTKIAVVLSVVAVSGMAIDGRLALGWELAAKLALLAAGAATLWSLGVLGSRATPSEPEPSDR